MSGNSDESGNRNIYVVLLIDTCMHTGFHSCFPQFGHSNLMGTLTGMVKMTLHPDVISNKIKLT